MKHFAALYAELDASTATEAKLAALLRYLANAEEDDAAWAVYVLAGGRPRQAVPTALLRQVATAQAGIPEWLFEECYQAVGDLAETIAHVLPPPTAHSALPLSHWMIQRLLPLRTQSPDQQVAALRQWFDELDADERFLLVKLIGGGFRVGVSKLLVQRALAQHAGLDAKLIAQRMMGYTGAHTPPDATRLQALISQDTDPTQQSGQPYPFFLAHSLSGAPDQSLGARADWLVEWKYDGIRAQLVRRAGRVWIWSRGEELITERFPEVVVAAQGLPNGCVLDGELLVWRDDRPAPFQLLQQRINRKTVPRKLLAEAPVRFIAYDLLEHEGMDIRALPQHARRARLESLLEDGSLSISPELSADDWAALSALRDASRENAVEGLMLKHRSATYGSGRTKSEGVWWKWKIDPLTVDGVLIYAQAGHGRRAGVYTDYSFAVWSRAPRDAAEAQAVVDAIARGEPPASGALQLVAFSKAYSGLTDEEFKAVDARIRATTLEKFGPVRSVKPTMVFELAFEGIQHSKRHKCGIALRFPRMLRLRDDKPLHEADTLATLQALLG